jgi:hypothetical protein
VRSATRWDFFSEVTYSILVSQEIPGTAEHACSFSSLVQVSAPSPHVPHVDVTASARLECELVPRVLGSRPARLQQPYLRRAGNTPQGIVSPSPS